MLFLLAKTLTYTLTREIMPTRIVLINKSILKVTGGPYWIRTSDLYDVNVAL